MEFVRTAEFGNAQVAMQAGTSAALEFDGECAWAIEGLNTLGVSGSDSTNTSASFAVSRRALFQDLSMVFQM